MIEKEIITDRKYKAKITIDNKYISVYFYEKSNCIATCYIGECYTDIQYFSNDMDILKIIVKALNIKFDYYRIGLFLEKILNNDSYSECKIDYVVNIKKFDTYIW